MDNAWKNQRVLKRGNIPTIGEIRELLLSIKKQRDRVFISLSYLTAGRVSEIIGLQERDITVGTKKSRKILIVRLGNRKSRTRPFKSIPIPFDSEYELLNDIIGYISGRGATLWGFKTPQRAWQIIGQHMSCNPHWLRHLRLTHLVTIYDFNEQLLMRWAGWSSTKESRHYMELRIGDFLDKL